MPRPLGENKRSGSTPGEWEWRRIAVPPAGPTRTAPKGPKRLSREARDGREPLTITVKYRGGAEGWWELRARGGVIRLPGTIDLHTALSRVYRGDLSES